MRIRVLDVFMFLLALGILGVVSWKVYGRKEGTPMLMIQSSGEEYLYPLDQSRELIFSGAAGESVVIIDEGKAFVRSSDCREKICVQMGAIEQPGEWAACLPNQLLLRIENEDDSEKPDSVSY